MKVKMILPALTEAKSPFFRPIKYSLFPPLGLATLAGYLDDRDEVTLQDEHVERLDLTDEPDLVVIEVYITSAARAYQIADHYRARGAFVALGGLHVTSCPAEAAPHADAIFLGPGEATWPAFLRDFRAGSPKPSYQSSLRTLQGAPRARRDLIKRHLYLVPNSLVVSRGCPHICDFCYKEAFFEGGKSFYTQSVDDALGEIERLPGRHLYFLDDHLFGNARFASDLFDGMRGMNRLWQAAGTVKSVLDPRLLEKAVASGLRSLFVGFETLSGDNLREQSKFQNLNRDYAEAIRRLHGAGVMINASFVFGMDHDGPDVFQRTVDWAIRHGIETATFHILTPYPGTALYKRMDTENRLLHRDWDLYDTRHAVFRPARLTVDQLEAGYWNAYHDFYRWSNIARGAAVHDSTIHALRHFAYAAGWKKFEPLWDWIIRAKRVASLRPALESILSGFGRGTGRAGEIPIPFQERMIRAEVSGKLGCS
ncbi:MAG: B12-binding domain-containing radical SAM protein [Chthoniobacteraceae bacterium]